jgi:hypothetical protein
MKSNTVSNHSESKNESETTKLVTYVVTRDGYRVEDKEYDSPSNEDAIATKNFWEKVSKNHSWGEKVVIVKYDSKQHRVW